MCQWNCTELLPILWWKFMDLSLSRNFFDLDRYFLKPRVLRASKRVLEREISTTVDRDWIFFLAKFSKYKHFNKQVNHFTVKLRTLSWVFERIKSLDGIVRMNCNFKVTDRAPGRWGVSITGRHAASMPPKKEKVLATQTCRLCALLLSYFAEVIKIIPYKSKHCS